MLNIIASIVVKIIVELLYHCGKDYRRVAFTCKSCFCLSCAKIYTDNFMSQTSKFLRDGLLYRHVTLTLPEQVKNYFYRARNDDSLLSALIHCGYACLEDVVSTVVKQKVKIGASTVVQTHGRSGEYNPHLHIIMTSGGINENSGKWVDLRYFPYEIIHKKWQHHLCKMLKNKIPTDEMRRLVDGLYEKYPKGFVAHVSNGAVPERCQGLARYLAKYVVSPPIAIKRIIHYDGQHVTYWYKDHKTKTKKVETVDALTFIGRMVQHILPKGFQRVRYYGLQATKTFKKWSETIKEGLRRIGRVVKGTYRVIAAKRYRERYLNFNGRDPMICRYCGHEMGLWKIWHPKYGVIYDEWENIKAGKYEPLPEPQDRRGRSLWPSGGAAQLSLFPVKV